MKVLYVQVSNAGLNSLRYSNSKPAPHLVGLFFRLGDVLNRRLSLENSITNPI
jgi:hypothetical protein